MTQLNNPTLISPIILGKQTLQTYTTAQLPPAGTVNNGLVVLEDGGVGDGNLVIYVNGLRYRINGGTAF